MIICAFFLRRNPEERKCLHILSLSTTPTFHPSASNHLGYTYKPHYATSPPVNIDKSSSLWVKSIPFHGIRGIKGIIPAQILRAETSSFCSHSVAERPPCFQSSRFAPAQQIRTMAESGVRDRLPHRAKIDTNVSR